MKTKVILTAVLLVILSTTMNAQEKVKKFGFELNSGVSFATAEQDMKTGFSCYCKYGFNFQHGLIFKIPYKVGAQTCRG